MTQLCAHLAVFLAILAGTDEVPAPGGAQPLVSSGISNRILKHFDFDERRRGNYESMPKGWRPITGEGYPRFAESRFDSDVGHSAPPSFRFDIAGGSMGAAYVDRTIGVHPGSDYEIVAWVRTSDLPFARVVLSGVLVDHGLHEIAASRCSSELTTPRDDGSWHPIRLVVRGGFPKARWLEIICEVLPMPGRADVPRPIHRQQVRGSAWFDDILVTRLPRVALEMERAGGVLYVDEPTRIKVCLDDFSGGDLDCRIKVLDGAGRSIASHDLTADELKCTDTWVDIGELPAGWYECVLEVGSGGQHIVESRRAFVRLARHAEVAPSPGNDAGAVEGFGILLRPWSSGDEKLATELLRALSPAAIKVPVWSAESTDEQISRGSPGLYQFLSHLNERQIALIAVLGEVPPGLMQRKGGENTQAAYARMSVASLLASPMEQWRAWLALPVTRYGRFFDYWQIGYDCKPETDIGKLQRAIANIRTEFPTLRLAHHFTADANRRDSSGWISSIPSTVSANSIEHLPVFGHPVNRNKAWVSVETDSNLTMADGGIELHEYAQKLIESRCRGASMAFSSQPWCMVYLGSRRIAQPTEHFVIIHTLSHLLGDLTPRMGIPHGEDIRTWLWTDAGGRRGAITAWARADGASREMILDVSDQARVFDLNGNMFSFPVAEGGRQVRLSAMPVIIAPVDPERIMLAASLKISSPQDAPGTDDLVRLTAGAMQPQRLKLTNPAARPLRGELHLKAPPHWHVTPAAFQIDLAPGKSFEAEISIRVPINAPTGESTLSAHFRSPGSTLGDLHLRTPVQIEPRGVDVNVMSRAEDGGVRVFQRISSLIDRPMRLRSFVVSGGRRMGAGVFELGGRQELVREFKLDGGQLRAGSPIRVSLEQIDGPVRDNRIIIPATKPE